MDLNTITVADFKTRFYRDFYYTNQNPNQEQTPPPNIDTVQDIDITNAFMDAQALFNQGLISSADGQTFIQPAYLYLSAHCLCLNLKAASNGINSGGTGGFPVNGRTVGSVSESYTIPQAYIDDPVLAQYTQTAYGMKYLAMVLPYLRGNMVGLIGGAHAAR